MKEQNKKEEEPDKEKRNSSIRCSMCGTETCHLWLCNYCQSYQNSLEDWNQK